MMTNGSAVGKMAECFSYKRSKCLDAVDWVWSPVTTKVCGGGLDAKIERCRRYCVERWSAKGKLSTEEVSWRG